MLALQMTYKIDRGHPLFDCHLVFTAEIVKMLDKTGDECLDAWMGIWPSRVNDGFCNMWIEFVWCLM